MSDPGDALFDGLSGSGSAYVKLKCARCNRTQPFAFGSSEVGAEFAEVKFTCAYCRYRNQPSGIHETIAGPSGQLRMAFHDMTREQLADLRARLKEAASSAQTVEDLAAVVEPSAPQIAMWLRSRENRNEVYTVLGLLIAVITLWLTLSEPPTPSQLNQVIQNIETGNYRDMPVKRNDECLCGMEKKHKNCHGRPETADEPDTWPKDMPWLGSRESPGA